MIQGRWKNIDQMLFEYQEGRLGEKDKRLVESLINEDDEVQSEWQYWKQTSLKNPDLAYANQSSLLKFRLLDPATWSTAWVVGSSVVLLGVSGLIISTNEENRELNHIQSEVDETVLHESASYLKLSSKSHIPALVFDHENEGSHDLEKIIEPNKLKSKVSPLNNQVEQDEASSETKVSLNENHPDSLLRGEASINRQDHVVDTIQLRNPAPEKDDGKKPWIKWKDPSVVPLD